MRSSIPLALGRIFLPDTPTPGWGWECSQSRGYGSIAGQACRYLGVGVGQEAFNVLNLSKDIANCLARTRSLCQPCTARRRKADRNKGVCWFVSVIQADFRSVFLASPFPLTSSKAVIRRALCAGDGGWHR